MASKKNNGGIVQTSYNALDKKSQKIKPEKGRWGDHRFTVSSSMIKPFTDLSITGSSETEEKEKNEQKHVSRKRGNPTEVTMTVILNAFTGANVREEAMAFVEEARQGKTNYLYVGAKKLISAQLMLTNASVQEISIAPSGKWTNAKVSLTFKQYAKGGTSVNDSGSGSGSSGGGSGGSGGGVGSAGAGSNKASVQNQSVTTTSGQTTLQKIGNAVKDAYDKVGAIPTSKVTATNSTMSKAIDYITGVQKTLKNAQKPAVVKSQRLNKMSLTS